MASTAPSASSDASAPQPASRDPGAVEWLRSQSPVPYRRALEAMEARNAAIRQGEAREQIWLLEHPEVYTAGTSADPAELINPQFDVVKTGRGGRYTYHGPGQRVGYTMLDLAAPQRGKDVRCFVHAIENWVIATLADFGIEAWSVNGRVGIWTRDIDGREAKIGAIGVRVRRWVTCHGFSVNLAPDLAHFEGIVPCGIAEFGVTSFERLGIAVTADEWDGALIARSSGFFDALSKAGKRSCDK